MSGVRAVLAARDMAAERRRAAALDGRHHLQLVEADVARHWRAATPPRGRGRYPRPPALDGTQLASRYAGGWSFLLFLGLLRGCDSRSSGLSMPAIMPVATRV